MNNFMLKMKAKYRSVVYTAITKGYDSLVEQDASVGKFTEFVAFMEDPVKSKTWTIRHLEKQFSDPNRNAKIHKVLSHKFFLNYEYSLWVDGNVKLLLPVEKFIQDFLYGADMAVFAHPLRSCLYKEANKCKENKLDSVSTIQNQINRYKKEKVPPKKGLFECTILLRRHSPVMNEFNEMWWHEICNGSKRDQISFPYVLRKSKVEHVCLPHKFRSKLFKKTENHNIKHHFSEV